MSQNTITFLRAAGTVIAFAVLSYVANATNLSLVLSPTMALIVSGVAASLLATFDNHLSPSGTVGFGTVGTAK